MKIQAVRGFNPQITGFKGDDCADCGKRTWKGDHYEQSKVEENTLPAQTHDAQIARLNRLMLENRSNPKAAGDIQAARDTIEADCEKRLKGETSSVSTVTPFNASDQEAKSPSFGGKIRGSKGAMERGLGKYPDRYFNTDDIAATWPEARNVIGILLKDGNEVYIKCPKGSDIDQITRDSDDRNHPDVKRTGSLDLRVYGGGEPKTDMAKKRNRAAQSLAQEAPVTDTKPRKRHRAGKKHRAKLERSLARQNP